MKKISIPKNENQDWFTEIANGYCRGLIEAFGLYAFYRSKIMRKIDKDVVDVIKQYYNKKKLICFVSLDRYAVKIDKDKRTLERWQKTLEDHGWIIINKYQGYYIIELGEYKVVDGIYIERFYADNNKICNNQMCKIKPEEDNKSKYNTIKKQIQEYEEKFERKSKSRKQDIQIPSKMPAYSGFKRKDINDWNAKDLLGYYLNKYVELHDMEDTVFVGLSINGSVKYQKIIKNTRERLFDDNNEKTKDYIDWAFGFATEKGHDISIPYLFSQTSFVVKSYLLERSGKKKNRKNEAKNDNNFSNNDHVKKMLQSKGRV